MSRAERLLALMQVLRRHRRPVSGAALAEATGVSLPTLYRDLSALKAQGAAVEGEAGIGYVLRPGDRVVYYSPTGTFGGCDKLQAFTALGTVTEHDVYQADTGAWRRDVAWDPARQVAIADLDLAFRRGRSWGWRLRRGLVEIGAGDMAIIEAAMATGAAPPCRRAA